MIRFTYFCLYIASNREESKHFFVEIEKYHWNKTFNPHTIYFIALHSTVRSPLNGVWKWQDGVLEQLLRIKGHKHSEWTHILQECIKFIIKQFPRPFDGLIYSGHGGGVSIGKWYRNGSPYFKLCDVISIFVEHNLTFPFMFFNSCYMGSFLSLLEYSRITNWVAADPGYNAWESITTTNTFWKRTKDIDIGLWMSACVTEYHEQHSIWNYKCYMIFDLHDIPELFREMKQTKPMKWAWKRKYILSYYHDSSTYDLYSILENMNDPTIHERNMIRLIRHMMRYSHLCERKKGPSIQWGRFAYMEDRYVGSLWWEFWKNVNTQTVFDGHIE
jgi:hypothetical protein